MYLNEIIKSTLGLEDYNLYLEDTEFSLADLDFKDVYEIDQLDYECTEEPEIEEEELDIEDFIN